jgi:hypothetical protein
MYTIFIACIGSETITPIHNLLGEDASSFDMFMGGKRETQK